MENESLKCCETETIPGKSFVTRPDYPPSHSCYIGDPPGSCQGAALGQYPECVRNPNVFSSEVPTRPLTYLACPYSDPNPGVMEWRYEQATKAAAWLISKHQLNVFSPITHSHPLHKLGGCKGDWNFWEEIDREYLSVSNTLMILYLDGWAKSTGVNAELFIAKEMGLRVEFLVPLSDGGYRITKDPGVLMPLNIPIAQDPPQCDVGGRRWGSVSDAIKDICGGEKMRTFQTGATRNADTGKPDYEGFLSPLALEEFGKYMLSHQIQADGSLRASDNWQKGIPLTAYMKSLWRHLMAVWMLHRGYTVPNDEQGRPVTLKTALSATIFNAQGYLHEVVKKDREV
jgi:hypothetical protein